MGSEFDLFDDLINEALDKHGLKKGEEAKLKEILPPKKASDGNLQLIKMNGLALTEDMHLTKAAFFDNLQCDNEKYGNITLTASQAKSLANTYRKLSTGVNSVVPIRCVGEKCPFKDDCWYYKEDKAPIGEGCLIERDLLIFHTKRLMDEYAVEPNRHSELMLMQELAETYIYEMRATMVLAKPENAEMYGIRYKFTPDGEPIEEKAIHWAYELKEKIKNRRLKILDALIGTRKSKAAVIGNLADKQTDYTSNVKAIREKIENASKIFNGELK